jgi:hypothetical protein
MGLLFAIVVAVAAAVWIARGMRARAARARFRTGPGTSLESAIPVRSFDDIDRDVATRRCHCGSWLQLAGEGTRQDGTRRYRVVRLGCDECEEGVALYFDVSDVLH